ncbi:carboxylesterase family protein [Streptococcus ruminantium]|uniref:carboxylesterase family protein n=1 Tax=Streptococcus ruminantium TaxID=1917441 RepID=UPI0012DCD876|nr:carboxylesterase family protein [Streptococcus ruminantium]
MKRKLLRWLSLCLLLFLVACDQTDKERVTRFKNDTTQTITSGKIKGNQDKENGVLEWLGLPYAAAPVGDLRWKEPQPVESWNGTFDATVAGEKFIQFSNGEVVGSETALNLDVVRPDSTAVNLPVVVFLHGGNNQTGHAQEIRGNTFVKDMNAIYVSVNYRLGALGFNPLVALKTGTDLENSGNYSLLDIAAALDWVQENIEVFGGDKNNVTLTGFSAGGRDVMATLISPLFKGKYHKAISYSGGMTLADEATSQEVFAKALAPLVVEDGKKADEVAAKDWLLSSDPEVQDYLYSLSAARLAPLMGNAGIRMSVFPHLFKDGTVIPKEGFDTKTYNDVPLLLVTGTSEFSLFSAFDKRFSASFSDGSLFKDEEKRKEFTYAETYGSQLYRLSNTMESARVMKGRYRSPIYIGQISYGDNATITPTTAAFLGAFHGVFEPLLQKPSNYTRFIEKDFESEGAQALSADFKTYLKFFVANGDPNGGNLEKWPVWTASGQEVLSMDADTKKAIIKPSSDKETAEDILKKMDADMTLPNEVKDELNKTVLNGRWFSSVIDEKYKE